MAIVGLNETEQEAILQTVAAVLHLGNIVFTDNEDDHGVLADDAAESALVNVSLLLQVIEILMLAPCKHSRRPTAAYHSPAQSFGLVT